MLNRLEATDPYSEYMPHCVAGHVDEANRGIYIEVFPDHFSDARFQLRDMIQASWQKMYGKAIMQISGIVMGKENYYIVRFYPRIISSSAYEPCIRLELNYSIMVAPQKEMIIPIWSYEPHTGKIIEWRCGYCNTANEKIVKFCTQCGAPRALLIQEMEETA